MRRAIVLVLAWGCGHTHNIGLFVHSVSIVNGELLVERCMLQQTSNKVTADLCTTERHALPMTGAVPPAIVDDKAPPAP